MTSQTLTSFSLPKNASMRDVGDFCVKNGIPSLAQGMIELPPPEILRKLVAQHVMRGDLHQYRDRYGEDVYLTALEKLLNNHYGLNVTKKNLLGVQGVTAACVSTMVWLKSQNKTRIGLISPFYTYHLKEINIVFGKDPEFIKMFDEDDLVGTPKLDVLEEALQKGLDMVLLCNPGNPTTKVWKKEELLQVLELTKKYGSYLMIDECYVDMVWDGKSPFTPLPPNVPSFPEHVFICRGFSKVLGLQSWRAGYLIAHESLIPQIMTQHDPIYVCIPFVQHAIAEYLDEHYESFKQHCEDISNLMRSNWKKLSAAFQSALGWEAVEPQGSMYGLFKYNNKYETDSEAVIDALKHGVGVVPAQIFFPGSPAKTGYIRIHCGVSSEKADKIVQNLENSKKQ